MKQIQDARGYLLLLWDGELVLSSEFVGGPEDDSVAKTKTYGNVSEDLVVALVLASVVAVAPPSIGVKLLSSIKLLIEKNKNEPDDDIPF